MLLVLARVQGPKKVLKMSEVKFKPPGINPIFLRAIE